MAVLAGSGAGKPTRTAAVHGWMLLSVLVAVSLLFVVRSHWVLHATHAAIYRNGDAEWGLPAALPTDGRPRRPLSAEAWAGFAPQHVAQAAGQVSADRCTARLLDFADVTGVQHALRPACLPANLPHGTLRRCGSC